MNDDGQFTPPDNVVQLVTGTTMVKPSTPTTGYHRPRYRRNLADENMRAQIAERRAAAFKLIVGGFTAHEIGLFLHADPTVNSRGNQILAGYGWQNYLAGKPPVIGEALGQSVRRDRKAVLDEARENQTLAVDDYVLRSVARQEALISGLWSKAQQGDSRAAEIIVKCDERIAKLLGADAPTKVDQRVQAHVAHTHGVQPDMAAEDHAPKFFDALVLLDVLDAVPDEDTLKQLGVVGAADKAEAIEATAAEQ